MLYTLHLDHHHYTMALDAFMFIVVSLSFFSMYHDTFQHTTFFFFSPLWTLVVCDSGTGCAGLLSH